MARSSLATYKKKRDFQATPEPPPEIGKDWRPASGKAAARGGRFVVHEHHASRLHFDLRLEMGGVLKSYAVPKGPSLDPKDRRLAVNTEDHPVKYLTFQGSIGDGQYGAGQMVIWDTGTYTVTPGEDPLDQYAKGRLHLEFKGEKLKGGFMLIRTARDDRQWLFFKKKDEAAEADWQPALILPYGARAERPAGFEIPKEALRNASTRRAALAKASATPGAKAASTKATGTKASRSKASSSKDSSSKDFKAGEVKAVKAAKASSAGKTDGKSWPAGARKSPLPDFIEPMLATLADKPFDDPKWVFETKWDGWRALMRKDASGLHLISRSAKSLDAMFPELLDTGGLIKAESCMLDGEIVALDAEGVPRFQLLQNRLKGKGRLKAGRKAGSGSEEGRMVFYAFDVPFCGGMDLTACRLIDRKAVLARILPAPKRGKDPGPLRGSAHFEGSGIRIFEEAVRLGFEGVVAKLKDGPYRKGRSADWLKVKGHLRQEVVIGGYTEPRGSRTLFGSLVAGLYQGGEFVFAGHVGGGFNARLLKEVHGFMEPLRIKASPFAKTPKTNEKVQWIRPRLVAEVEFAEWTDDGRMRQPIFMGLRPDKDPKACVREEAQPAERLVESAGTRPGLGTTDVTKAAKATGSPAGSDPGTGPVITHPDKVLWPEEGYTKGDLIAYYTAVAPFILPHLKDRPLILKRYPNGIGAPPFYQHDVKTAPAFVKTIPVREEDGSLVHYALCQNPETLIWLANMGVIPQNPWLSRAPELSRPDWIVFDLDPPGDVAFPEVCSLALYLREILEGLGLKVFAKTSGSRGIHIYVPLKPAYDFTQSLGFAQLVGAYAVKVKPDSFTVERSLKARKTDRIYLDCMQNSEGKSVASVYSVREKPGATVSAPLEWAELKRKVRMEDFDIRTMPKRLEKRGDLFAEVLKTRNSLEGALRKLEKLLQPGR